ncbi:MAG: phosphate ABC transporter substrate-binding protein, partial [Lactobacillus ruminis]|nr:phosphate ABC transporter substrate-binding protein [Ligilactobacillus ruminis]
NKHLEEYVAKTPGAIGYLAFPYLKDSKPKLKKIKIDNVTPTAEHVKDNSWKIWAYEHMYTRGMSRGEASKFITYMLGDDVQDGMLQKAGYISIHDMEVQKDEHGAMVKTGN